MKLFVLDCSVAMAWCFEDESNMHSDKILKSLKDTKAIVPMLWPLEIMNVLHIAERKKRISLEQSEIFIDFLNNLPIERELILSEKINKRILEISRKYAITAYDAAYLEIAIRKHVPLASFDKNLCNAAKLAHVQVL